MKRGDRHHQRGGQNRATRLPHTIAWVNAAGTTVDKEQSSTRRRRAKRHVERLRNTRQDEGLTPYLMSRT